VAVVWTGEDEFTVDGVGYRAKEYLEPDSSSDNARMMVLKSRPMIEIYEHLIAELEPKRILELGIYDGGSTALLAQLAKPEQFAALDLRWRSGRQLEQFIASHHLEKVVTLHDGVDQADTDALDRIVATFSGPVDLIVDDASHLLDPTRTSFNRLFPYLRAGGWYLIEDWSWPHQRIPHRKPDYRGVPALSLLTCELVLAAACRPKVVAEVRVTPRITLVRKGENPVRPGFFDLAARFDPVGAEIMERIATVQSLEGDNT
jgi:predicted O-methyltransferase YrrM